MHQLLISSAKYCIFSDDSPLINPGTNFVSTDDYVQTDLGRPDVNVRPGQTLYIDSNVDDQVSVSWEKDGKEITTGDRFTAFPNGTLRIMNFNENDAGNYVGVASTTDGRRERQPIRVIADSQLNNISIYYHHCFFCLQWRLVFYLESRWSRDVHFLRER